MFTKHYAILYFDNVPDINPYGIKYTRIQKKTFETDEYQEYLDMLTTVTACKLEANGFDNETKEFIYGPLVKEYNTSNKLSKMKMLEYYFGEKQYSDFVKDEVDRYGERAYAEAYNNLFWRSDNAYKDYLNKIWGYKFDKIKKPLPRVQKEDDPYMTLFEIESRKKEDKEKLEKFL